MKKSIKLLSLLLAMGLIAGCSMNKPNSEPKSEDNSVVPSITTSDDDKSSEEIIDSSEEQPSSIIEHTHSWESNWTSDPDYHWHKCSGCSEINDKAAHTWDAGKVTKEAGAYTTGIKTYECTICKHTKTEEIPATGGGETEGAFTFDETALNTPQEIHTANQKKYLNLGIEYYHITSTNLDSCNATGNSNQSTPNKVTVSWNYTAPTGKTISKFELLISSS